MAGQARPFRIGLFSPFIGHIYHRSCRDGRLRTNPSVVTDGFHLVEDCPRGRSGHLKASKTLAQLPQFRFIGLYSEDKANFDQNYELASLPSAANVALSDAGRLTRQCALSLLPRFRCRAWATTAGAIPRTIATHSIVGVCLRGWYSRRTIRDRTGEVRGVGVSVEDSARVSSAVPCRRHCAASGRSRTNFDCSS